MDAETDLKPAWKTKPELERIRAELDTETTFNFTVEMEQEASDRALIVEEAPPANLMEEERKFEEEKYARLQDKVASRRDFQVELITMRQEARQRLTKAYDKKQKRYLLAEERTAYEEHARHATSTKQYHKAEHRLKRKLKEKAGDVTLEMRETADAQSLFESEVRTYKVTWKRRPQPIEIRLHQARIVKDKLQQGEYSIRAAIWDRLGGQPIAFSKEDPTVWKRQSRKLEHGGDYSDLELLFDDSLVLLAPSRVELRPTMIVIFELILHGTRDEILGTAVFPLCNSELEYAQGTFKAPILRGIIHKRLERFSDIESLYSSSIDDWLCNLYFEIHRQSPLLVGQKDYTVVLTRQPEDMEQVESKGFEEIDYETLRTPDQFIGYQQSVALDEVFSNPVKRAHYIAAEMISELGILAYRHMDFYITLFFLGVSIWLSRYTHYIGEFLFLKGQHVPVTTFDVRPYTIEIKYPAEMSLSVEIGVVLLGLVFTLSCFIFLGISAYAAVRFLGRFPSILYRFVACFGIITVLDCVVTIIEVLIRNKSDGDMYKLYNYFGREEGSPAIGAFLTAFMYIGFMGICLFFFYTYLLYIHMNGRLLDMYMRLTAPEDHFFIPADCEVSLRYLDWVCFKARNYRAVNGDVRRVNVSEFIVAGESYRHICIYTVGNDHSRMLFRHFLVLPSGAVCELTAARLS